MARGRLTSTPSGGQSEVLETLHYEGAIRAGVQICRLIIMVSERWGGANDRSLSNPQFTADAKTVIATLATRGFVTGHDTSGASIDLTASQPDLGWVALTGSGRAAARAPRPRVRQMRG